MNQDNNGFIPINVQVKQIIADRTVLPSPSKSPKNKNIFLRKPIISKTRIEKSSDNNSGSTTIVKQVPQMSPPPQASPQKSKFSYFVDNNINLNNNNSYLKEKDSILEGQDLSKSMRLNLSSSRLGSASPRKLIKKSEDQMSSSAVQVVKVKRKVGKLSKTIKLNKLNKANNFFQADQSFIKNELQSEYTQQDENVTGIIQDYIKLNMQNNYNVSAQQKYENLKKLLIKLKSQGGKYKTVFQIILVSLGELFVIDGGKFQQLIKSVGQNGRYNINDLNIPNDYQSVLNYVNDNFYSYDNFQKQKIRELELQVIKQQQQLKTDVKELQEKIFKLQHEKYDIELDNKLIKAELQNIQEEKQKELEKQNEQKLISVEKKVENQVKEEQYTEALQQEIKVLNIQKRSLDLENNQQINIMKQCYSLITVIRELIYSQQNNVIQQIQNLTQDSVMQGLLKQIKGKTNPSIAVLH